jgi:hemoglobin
MNTRKLTTTVALLAATLLAAAGCGAGGQKTNKDFFTSGNREADQRADQRMVKSQQLKGEGSGNSDDPKADANLTLYQRLGGQQGLTALTDDWLARALDDPRVNWQRHGVVQGGFSFHHNRSVTWNDSPANVAQLKKHMVQFLSLATGGPAHYDGKEMKQAHANLHITNAEFDAAVGDLKASLDKLRVPTKEQKELLSIIESTRPQVAEER